MAKAKGTTSKKPSHKGAPPRTNDAERLAALRWLCMRIEQLCIELFVTDRDKFGAVETSLKVQVRLLQEMGRPIEALDDEDCPEGYVLCRDGLCAPMCDGFTSAASAPGKGHKGGKRGKKKR